MLTGNAGAWLPQFRSLGDRFFTILGSVWPDCLAPLIPIDGPLTLENRITNQLVLAIIRSKRLPARIIPQYALLTEKPNGTAHLSSEVDFVIAIGDDESVYLACECKRLNVPFPSGKKSLASEYLDDGLGRFSDGKYAAKLPYALMLGFVMDGNVPSAQSALHNSLSSRKSTLNMMMMPVANDENPFSTYHDRPDQDPIEVVHRLLSWPS